MYHLQQKLILKGCYFHKFSIVMKMMPLNNATLQLLVVPDTCRQISNTANIFIECSSGFGLDGNKCVECRIGTYRGDSDPQGSCISCPEGNQHIIEVNWQSTVVVSYKYSKTGSLRFVPLTKSGNWLIFSPMGGSYIDNVFLINFVWSQHGFIHWISFLKTFNMTEM